jgi:hypothetical protein
MRNSKAFPGQSRIAINREFVFPFVFSQGDSAYFDRHYYDRHVSGFVAYDYSVQPSLAIEIRSPI